MADPISFADLIGDKLDRLRAQHSEINQTLRKITFEVNSMRPHDHLFIAKYDLAAQTVALIRTTTNAVVAHVVAAGEHAFTIANERGEPIITCAGYEYVREALASRLAEVLHDEESGAVRVAAE